MTSPRVSCPFTITLSALVALWPFTAQYRYRTSTSALRSSNYNVSLRPLCLNTFPNLCFLIDTYALLLEFVGHRLGFCFSRRALDSSSVSQVVSHWSVFLGGIFTIALSVGDTVALSLFVWWYLLWVWLQILFGVLYGFLLSALCGFLDWFSGCLQGPALCWSMCARL